MRRETFTKCSLAMLMMGLSACGTSDAGLSAAPAFSSAALAKDPAGKFSVIAAAAALLPAPEAGADDSENPPPDCDTALELYTKAFNQLNGMVEWHALYSVSAYQAATAAGSEANAAGCSASLRSTAKDCSELLSTYNEQYEVLRGTPQYQTLDATGEWNATIQAYQVLKQQSCLE